VKGDARSFKGGARLRRVFTLLGARVALVDGGGTGNVRHLGGLTRGQASLKWGGGIRSS